MASYLYSSKASWSWLPTSGPPPDNRRPKTLIGRRNATQPAATMSDSGGMKATTVLELSRDWTVYTNSVEIDLGDDGLCVRLMPYNQYSQAVGRSLPSVVSGAISAFRRRFGHSIGVDLLNPDVVEGLKRLETIESMRWLVRAIDE